MGIIENRIEEIFNKLKKSRNVETFILNIASNIDYSWKWQRDNAREEIANQLKLLDKEGFVWQIAKK